MKPERWKKIDEIVQTALELDEAEDRPAFLDSQCRGDPNLRHEVESLIAYQKNASSFLESPAIKDAAALMADAKVETLEGRTVSHYNLIRKLGEGGMGDVYLAHDISLNRRVAIKLLSDEMTTDESARKRLIREARAAACLDHANICSVYEVAEHEGLTYIVMQYIEGETLADRIGGKALEIREVLDIAEQVADGLAEAHAHGIIHRDIKPKNVMLTARGQVKVLDFGLAKMVRREDVAASDIATESMMSGPGVIAGTVPYMSPEQLRAEAIDTRSDIFSFGVVMYEMVTGQQPFARDSSAETIAAIQMVEPASVRSYREEAPEGLESIVERSLQKTRGERYRTAKDLLIDIKSLKHRLEFEEELERSSPPNASESGKHSPLTAAYARGALKRHKLGVSLTLAAIVVVAVAAFFYFNRKPVLTDKDMILLADFVNTTGDAVFDGALKQALAIQLEQSPFLNIFSDQRVREALRFMNRSPDERMTKDIAREICERQGLKAYLLGSISNLGSHFVITLEAVNAQTGDVIVRQQIEAESKEQVLSALGNAATKLREKLGESLASIQKYDAPVQEVTTSSLEALKAFSMGEELSSRVKMDEAIPFYRRAVELDPNFALAYSELSDLYSNTGPWELAIEAEKKAFDLRERVSEREKLTIAVNHYRITGELGKDIEAHELLVRTYPRMWGYWNDLGYSYLTIGQLEKAVETFREAFRLYPNPYPPWGLGLALTRLNRFDEAKEVFEQGLARADHPFFHNGLYSIAFIKGDAGAMQQQVDWASARPDQLHLIWQGNAAAFSGQLRKAREFYSRGIEIEQRNNKNYANKELAARDAAWIAFREVVSGNCQHVKDDTAKSFVIAQPGGWIAQPGGWISAAALALCGENSQAQSLIDENAKESPKDTLVNDIYLPVARAAIQIRRGNPGRAIELLQPAKAYVGAGVDHEAPVALLWPEYMRGLAYLNQKAGPEAAAEFQTILDHRGMVPIGIHYPLAHLGMARAAVLSGDMAKARKYYQDFFTLWKNADSDLPIMIAARKEYEKLKIPE